MQTYSIRTEAKFMASVTRMAISVDAAAIREMANGPRSLHKRSILRILALSTS